MLVVTSIVGRMGRWQAIIAAVMLAQFILQSVLVLQRDSVPAIAALHPVNGVLILLFATWLTRDAWGVWQSRSQPSSVESVAPEAPTG
jgi:putative Ca2+/H+ antiporter (TMEM165/GDT1 family)